MQLRLPGLYFPSRSSFSATTPPRPPIFHPDLVSLQLCHPGLGFSIQIQFLCNSASQASIFPSRSIVRLQFFAWTSLTVLLPQNFAVVRLQFFAWASLTVLPPQNFAVVRLQFFAWTSLAVLLPQNFAVVRLQFFAWASLTVLPPQNFAFVRLQFFARASLTVLPPQNFAVVRLQFFAWASLTVLPPQNFAVVRLQFFAWTSLTVLPPQNFAVVRLQFFAWTSVTVLLPQNFAVVRLQFFAWASLTVLPPQNFAVVRLQFFARASPTVLPPQNFAVVRLQFFAWASLTVLPPQNFAVVRLQFFAWTCVTVLPPLFGSLSFGPQVPGEDSGHGGAPLSLDYLGPCLHPPFFYRHSAYLVWESGHGGAPPFQVSFPRIVSWVRRVPLLSFEGIAAIAGRPPPWTYTVPVFISCLLFQHHASLPLWFGKAAMAARPLSTSFPFTPPLTPKPISYWIIFSLVDLSHWLSVLPLQPSAGIAAMAVRPPPWTHPVPSFISWLLFQHRTDSLSG